jgi:hypothetical protein
LDKESKMNTHMKNVRIFSAVLTLGLAIMACNGVRLSQGTGEVRTETQSVDAGGATSASVDIEMGAGKLDVQGGANSLMDGTFRYNVDSWKPQVSYSTNGSQGDLVVSQPTSEVAIVGTQVNEWSLMLNGSIPLDIKVHTGAGGSVVDLSSLELSGLNVETGAGTTDINLSGNWDQDVNASITGGVGAIKVQLPAEMGVLVSVETGLGGVTTSGLMMDGDNYVNRAFGSAPNTLYLNIKSGVGGIELVAP